MKVVYIDSLFVVNFAVDYLLALATAKLCALPVRKLRFLLAALFGACYAAAAYIPGVPQFVGGAAVRVSAGVVLALIAFGDRGGFARHLLVFFGSAACFAGAALLVGRVSFKTLLVTVVAVYAVIAAVFRFAAAKKPGVSSATSQLGIAMGGRLVTVRVLNDSGNALRDPVSGAVLPVINYDCVKPLLAESTCTALESGLSVSGKYEALVKNGMSAGLVPYRAMGTEGGLMITLKADSLTVDGKLSENRRFAIAATE
ncbi:MAG: sigma-E processing peptidase SpoIIGA, partial [Oscillospiraceae bacterium]|nr:sigma-E processing peptidase SpoIIGA [Oscillospiraceae bacterium]